MIMRNIVLALCLFVCTISLAQGADEGRISIRALIPDRIILSADADRQLETKMQQLLTNNGFADNQYAVRFVLTAKVDITSKDVVPSTPPRISEKLDVTFFVGDVVENKVYASTTLNLLGIGINENKACISAINNIKTDNPKFKEMLEQAKVKIIGYYTNSCNEQITRAQTLTAIGQYDEAIANMMSVPNICSDCFYQCQQAAVSIYQQKIDAFGRQQLEKARNAWIKNPNVDGAEEVVSIINKISPASSVFADVEKLRSEISAKLTADDQRELERQEREWNLKVQAYKDGQTNKQAIIKACREVGVTWAKNQPKDITRTIIRGWW